jgi:ABC-2 type transport system permease protein
MTSGDDAVTTLQKTPHRHRRATFTLADRSRIVGALLAKSVTDRLTLAGIVGLLMVAMGAFVGALWPPLRETFAGLPSDFADAIGKALPGGDLTSGIGFANAELMSIVAPVGAIAVAVISAARGTAGEEEDKTLGILLAAPVGRLTFLFTKTVAMVIHVLIVGVLLAAGIVTANLIGELGITTSGIVGATVHTVLLGTLFGAIAILTGASTGNRRLTAAATGGLAALAFAISTFLPLSNRLADGAKISPWYYFNASNPLVNGPDPGHLLVLAAMTVIPIALAAAAFHRRDLRG